MVDWSTVAERYTAAHSAAAVARMTRRWAERRPTRYRHTAAWQWWCSSRRGRTAPPTTASASATCCATAAIAWSSSSRSRSRARSRRAASRSGSCDSGRRPRSSEAPGQFWKDFIRDTAPVFRTPTIEQLTGFIQPTWQALVDGARYVNPRLRGDHRRASARRDRARTTCSASRRCRPAACRGCGSCRATRWRCATRRSRRSSRGYPTADHTGGPVQGGVRRVHRATWTASTSSRRRPGRRRCPNSSSSTHRRT